MAAFEVMLAVASICIFAIALAGAVSVKCIAQISHKWMLLGNAAAGGVLIGVALVHMLAENAPELEGWGKDFAVAIGADGDEPFPLGFMLAGLGFFAIICMEALLSHHDHGGSREEGHAHGKAVDEREGFDEASSSDGSVDAVSDSGSDHGAVERYRGSPLAGFGTFIGIMIHVVIESVAMGAARSASALATLMVAVIFHKFFAAFALGTSLHGIDVDNPKLWWALVLIFAAAGPLGIVAGAVGGARLEGEPSAALQCVASGTLLAIGITEMLVPGLGGSKQWKKRRIVTSVVAFVSVSLLAAWA